MRLRLLPIVLAAAGMNAFAASPSVDALDPRRWHEPTAARSKAAAIAHDALRRALLAREREAIDRAVSDLREALGADLGRPEVKPDTAGPVSSQPPDLAPLLADWLRDCDAHARHDPWDAAAAASRAHRAPPRLRDSQRVADAYLVTSRLVDGAAAGPWRDRALAGFRYLRSCQASTGVFGYPFDAARQDRLGRHAAELVRKGEQAGHTMVENGWVIEDLGSGDLQFDNGVCGLAMLEAYALTSEREYLDSARHAADWAMQRPLVPNWNYNAFAGRLLAGVYRATKEPRYFEAACRTFDLGVLPGQTETGRWLDPHNARTQYHAILCTAVADYAALLVDRRSVRAEHVRAAAVRALDNLAAESVTYGPSNVGELLALEAFARGREVFGPHAEWDRAVSATLNALTPQLRSQLVAREGRLPAALPHGLLVARTPAARAAP